MASMEKPVSSERASRAAAPSVWNVPNTLTIARLVLAICCFVALGVDAHGTALVLFALGAGTDWVDGFWARRYGQITQLGRILDPFADKIIICGTFIFLAAIPASEIAAWVAVVVVGREMLVTGLRSFFEERGVDFSAKWAGKWKMAFQCAAVVTSLWRLWYFGYQPAGQTWTTPPPAWTGWTLLVLVWIAVVMTVYSGLGYAWSARRLLNDK
jgi:CDP-diacylglycerol--glycerol-3-phosphate 3-phosphatidyltransferase